MPRVILDEFLDLLNIILIDFDLREGLGLGFHADHVVEYLEQGGFPRPLSL